MHFTDLTAMPKLEDQQDKPYLHGRGAQINTANPYHKKIYDDQPVDWSQAEEEHPQIPTQYIDVHPKTIINEVTSPDIPLPYSMNPYQGCEHGCVYCYARNTHPYWGYSAGLEFEQKILVKRNSAALLEEKFRSPRWKAAPIMLSGNTDCYQPIERELKITRSILEVCWKYRHPVGLITKNSLIRRDIDLLRQLAEHNLVHTVISVTTLDEKLRQRLEPRTASVKQRLDTIEALNKAGIPVMAMLAPIIPGLNDHELFDMVKAVADRGALGAGYSIVRLNGDVGPIFTDWLEKNMPDRAQRVLNRIKDCHGGELNDSRFGKRMRGEGNIAEIINQQYKLAKKKFLEGRSLPPYNLELHEQFKSAQLRLF